ncbi:hypothetical protein RA307_09850 [Xanthobacteraceae bacterium Astr-EGSB]|uniref:prohead protease/major capsid protein fusion protein n=1 Tax=Astrobacterium formosum TaxID=3069710 RepID=UPI0027B3E922|nr:hypothetical protein [Xanthobacteraceae bacterium Astr-EGSB]
MKLAKLAALTVALALVAVAILVPDVLAVGAHPDIPADVTPGAALAQFVLAVGLDGLRQQRSDLQAQATAKMAEVTDGMSADAVRTIEDQHRSILANVATVDTAIAAEERRAAPPPASPPAPAVDLAAERTRASEITTLATRHAMPADFATRHISGGTALDEVRRLVLEKVASRSARISPRVTVLQDEGDTLRDAVETAIIHRANPRAVTIADDSPARQWRGMRLLEMGRAFHEEATGERLRGLSPMGLATRLLGLETGMRGGMSTSDFPAILANVVVKRLRNAYETAPSNWKRLARQSNSPDFKEKAVTQLSNLPTFVKVKEGAEYQYAALADGQEKYALSTYGRIVSITRQTLINDDMGAFDRLPTLLGRAAAETEAGIFWQIVTVNPAMADGVAIFHADHGNLAAAGAAIAVDSLGAGRAAMRKQKGFAKKGADAEPLNVAPAFLIVGPDKETQAQQFLATIVPGEGGKVNPFTGTLTLMPEARLSGNAWYLWADPATIDTIEYAYLDGEEGLYTEQRIGFEVDGIEVKGRVDFAAKAIDWRGVYKNPGA